MESIDDDWESFLQDDYGYEELPASSSTRLENNQINNDNSLLKNVDNIPKASDIYISTKTKICYLNKSNIDIKNIFWNIPVLDYSTPTNGVIKKQIKYSSIAKDETDYIEEQL